MNGDHSSGAGFLEEREFCGSFRLEVNLRGETGARKATFRNSHGETAIAYVMRRLHGARRCQCDKAIDERLLGVKINRRRSSGDNATNRLSIFRRRKSP